MENELNSIIFVAVMDKKDKYVLLTEQVKALAEGEADAVAVMANVSAAVQETMGFWWTGFYLEKGGELVLGPFQGPVACYRIPHGKGVCGTTYERGETIVVPDVEQFPGHIACSSLSRSEIVVPIYNKVRTLVGVLDIDSKELSTFDEIDKYYLEQIAAVVGSKL